MDDRLIATPRALPAPGDLVVSLRSMRAWINDKERGVSIHPFSDLLLIREGAMGIVIQRWQVPGEESFIKFRIMIDNKLFVVGHAKQNVVLNWLIMS